MKMTNSREGVANKLELKTVGVLQTWIAVFAIVSCLAMAPAAQSADEKPNASADANKLPPAAQKLMDAYNAAVQKERAKLIAGLKPMKEAEIKKKNQTGADAIQIAIDDMEGMAAVLAAMGTDNSGDAMAKKITINAKGGDRGVKIGDFKKGMKVKIQYVGGTWTFNKTYAKLQSPDEACATHNCVTLSAFPKKDAPVDDLIGLPKGTAETPFEYEFDKDTKNVSLRIGASSDKAEGQVTYKVTIMK